MQHTSGAESHAASRPRNQHSRNRTGFGERTRYRNLDDTGVTDGVISVTDTDVTRMMKTCMRTGLLGRRLVYERVVSSTRIAVCPRTPRSLSA